MASVISGTEDLTNGSFSLPDAGDDGEVWAAALEDFISRMATHTHNGSDSKDIVIDVNKVEVEYIEGTNNTFTETGVGTGVFESGDLSTPAVPSPTSPTVTRFYYLDGVSYIEFFPTYRFTTPTSIRIQTNEVINNFKVQYY